MSLDIVYDSYTEFRELKHVVPWGCGNVVAIDLRASEGLCRNRTVV
jgi:hypothetical protein